LNNWTWCSGNEKRDGGREGAGGGSAEEREIPGAAQADWLFTAGVVSIARVCLSQYTLTSPLLLKCVSKKRRDTLHELLQMTRRERSQRRGVRGRKKWEGKEGEGKGEGKKRRKGGKEERKEGKKWRKAGEEEKKGKGKKEKGKEGKGDGNGKEGGKWEEEGQKEELFYRFKFWVWHFFFTITHTYTHTHTHTHTHAHTDRVTGLKLN
jgi:hypothetical protein